MAPAHHTALQRAIVLAVALWRKSFVWVRRVLCLPEVKGLMGSTQYLRVLVTDEKVLEASNLKSCNCNSVV